MMNRFTAVLFSCFLGVNCVCAQQSLPSLQDALDSLEGTDVSVVGRIGTGLDITDDDAIFFRLANGTTYSVVFDAGRNARRSLKGCEFKMFGGTPCAATVKAEIEFDGSRIRLIIFELVDIGAPEKI